MKLHTINTGHFKLDGGAMFGVVPKSIWNKSNPADENNLCSWAMRSLLIEDGNRLILIDNGMGDKQDAKFVSHYYLHGTDSLHGNLKSAGFQASDITDMFLTHLHFDHCGGGVAYNGDKLELVFKNATYWSNEAHWDWAVRPNPREKASFLKENIMPMQESGHLKMVSPQSSPFDGIDILFMDGHTEKQMLPLISYKGRKIVFAADLIPSVGHIPLPYVMGYDTRPLQTMVEKEALLNKAVEEDYILFFEHDPVNECATLQRTDKGVRVKETFKLSEL
ncbi:Glyoxylase, beta-lactamase superfamily II [Flexibacter flexilis DSM 6793]|uniref:Glyoxylase, beta-lactamase superfamily II n=1 Tax=Flexibacter flexilis DSM 6793 TaxID=927664 RepID=A0A1I1HU93_9BACT|nr:MBL fold metallo-hydrolase [Flexibacter flexilis]SFC27441.1 Glyoxylase, beta-lactamase superfamily II [Flexibacter flexilis DSM 6793]